MSCIVMGMLILTTATGCGHRAGGVDLWRAVEQDDGDAVRAFKAAGGDVDVRAWVVGSTPLWTALEGKKRYAYEALLRCGADPNVVMSGKRVVTHWAALEHDPWWLRLALEHGADPNLVNTGNGQPVEGTPLEFAIGHHGSLENVKLLVEHGADLDRPNRFNGFPLAAAFAQASYDVVLYLLAQGADFTRAEDAGVSFLIHVGQLHEHRDEWFRMKEDRDKVVEIYEWLNSRGADLGGD